MTRPDWGMGKETVATVGDQKITRQEWLNELEERYGEDTLRDLVDKKVIENMADRYDIHVSRSSLEQELNLYKALYGSEGQNLSDKAFEEQVKVSLILEELLTKDAVISEEDVREYYNENESLFDIPASFHLSQIIVSTKSEAERTLKELEGGSSFSALAMERSLDEFSSNQGGDIGFISKDNERVEPAILQEAQDMREGMWSEPVKLEKGYAVLYLHEKVAGKKYTFSEVKDQIRRQIAIEQMDTPVSARAFWKEAGVSWFYGNKYED
jgi:foldase protein PrsA